MHIDTHNTLSLTHTNMDIEATSTDKNSYTHTHTNTDITMRLRQLMKINYTIIVQFCLHAGQMTSLSVVAMQLLPSMVAAAW